VSAAPVGGAMSLRSVHHFSLKGRAFDGETPGGATLLGAVCGDPGDAGRLQ
jgi:hypothetical protein